MAEYQQYFHGYVSLGTPHLGFLFNSSTLIDAGMWILKKWTNSQALKELSMTDAEQFHDTLLYRLSQTASLKHFKHIILIGSFQDRYSPCDSARIQISAEALQSTNTNYQKTYLTMAENVLSNLTCEELVRLEVNFRLQDNSFGCLIGQAAHV